MVHYCCVCKKRLIQRTLRSYHKFPSDPERKKIWLVNLRLSSNIPADAIVCSDHFNENDFIFTNKGKCLRTDAIPETSAICAIPSISAVNLELPPVAKRFKVNTTIIDEDTSNIESSPKTFLNQEQMPSTSMAVFKTPDSCSTLSSASPKIFIDSSPESISNKEVAPSTLMAVIKTPESCSTLSAPSPKIFIESSPKSSSNQEEIPLNHIEVITTPESSTLSAPSPKIFMESSPESITNKGMMPSIYTAVFKASDLPVRPTVGQYSSSETSTSSLMTIKSSDVVTDDQKKPPTMKSFKELGIKVPKRAKRYFGDCASSDMESPNRAKKSWAIAKKTILAQKLKIATLQKNKNRLRKKILSLRGLLKHLQEKFLSENACSIVNASLSDSAKNIIDDLLKRKGRQQYSETLRTFALTLNFYSSKAYNFVRAQFNNALPHPKTISKWYQTIDGSPGMSEEALQALKAKAAQFKEQNKVLFANMTMDEKYFVMRLHHRLRSEMENSLTERIRSTLTKTIIFKNQ